MSLLTDHLKRYPMMQTTDAVKLGLQSVYGAAHFGGNAELAAAQIKEEISKIEENAALFVCDPCKNYVRLELKNPLVRDLEEDIIARLFSLSATEDKATATEEKNLELSAFFDEIKEIFSPSEEERALMESLLESYSKGVFESVSHSDIYRARYTPSYRVISTKYFRFFSVLISAKHLSQKKDRVVIALEGRCAAGKSTASKVLSEILDAPIIKMDDFFLPFERKTPERLAEIAGNVDYERFLSEVVPNLQKNEEFTYNAYSCSDGSYREITVPKSRFLIVEGVYSMREEFVASYDLKVFLNVTEETQLERLEKRNPKLLDRFVNEWIPMEEKYFKSMKIKENCDLIIGQG